jgi:hypothetical protein
LLLRCCCLRTCDLLLATRYLLRVTCCLGLAPLPRFSLGLPL